MSDVIRIGNSTNYGDKVTAALSTSSVIALPSHAEVMPACSQSPTMLHAWSSRKNR
jgi:hypothetical protein